MQACRLTATDLACRRGDRVLFAGLSLALEGGHSLHLTGPNGVGKSSLIRLLGGLGQPYAGEVRHEGAIGLIDERTALDPELPLGRALAFWARIDAQAREAAEAVAALLGLDGLMDVPVRYLSTGQKKRAALARLVGQRAPIWLLDEPLNGLDTAAVELVGTIISDHCGEGGICIVASHQPLGKACAATLAIADYAP